MQVIIDRISLQIVTSAFGVKTLNLILKKIDEKKVKNEDNLENEGNH